MFHTSSLLENETHNLTDPPTLIHSKMKESRVFYFLRISHATVALFLCSLGFHRTCRDEIVLMLLLKWT